MKTKQWTVREFVKLLKYNGLQPVRVNGDHQTWKDNTRTIVITVNKINCMLARRLIKENNLKECL